MDNGLIIQILLAILRSNKMVELKIQQQLCQEPKKANMDSMKKLANIVTLQKVKFYMGLETVEMKWKKDRRQVEKIKLEDIKLHRKLVHKPEALFQNSTCKDLMKQYRKQNLKLELDHKFLGLDQFNKVKNQRPKRKWKFTKPSKNLTATTLKKSALS